ncbi:MAG: OmpA family protein, partial [Ignavibacteria bacterium]|nr:OmpA family protein [Ignavibacteria bacterium]
LGGGMNMLDKLYKDGRIVSHGILFDVNKATIKPQSMGTINEIVKALKQDSKIKLSIEGHTDSDGDDKLNQKLSEQRAESVKKALIDQGIDAVRLQTKGLGESKPIDNNTTPEGKANNRRVEFVLVK